MSFHRKIAQDRARTRDVIAGSPPAVGKKNWLGHFVDKGTGQLDALLLKGATRQELEAVRDAVDEHLYHLREEHGLCIIPEDEKLFLRAPAEAEEV